MILRKLVQQNDKGDVEATFALTKEQIGTLLNFAVVTLVSEGLATVEEVSEEELRRELHEDILDGIDPEHMPQA